MHIISIILNVVLAVFVVWEVVTFVPRYRELKLAIARGDGGARLRVYWRALRFEWISAALAVLALGFDWSKFNPKLLGLEGSGLFSSSAWSGDFARGNLLGVLAGVLIGTGVMIAVRIRARRRGVATKAPKRWWSRLLPDFSALLPATRQERLLWAAVALSAGICEEVVFRGWLLATLHGQLAVSGTALIALGAALFGLAHAYQGIPGVILTALAGGFFCLLYVATGSLLIPILLHALVDVRFAFLPAPVMAKPQPSFA